MFFTSTFSGYTSKENIVIYCRQKVPNTENIWIEVIATSCHTTFLAISLTVTVERDRKGRGQRTGVTCSKGPGRTQTHPTLDMWYALYEMSFWGTRISPLTSLLYRNWKLLGLLAASFTAWASSMEPRPPCAQWWHGTASEAPHSFASWHTRSISACVSVLNDHQRKHC